MDDKVRIALRNLVTEQGESLLSSRERLRGLLADDCPESTREINVLMIAVQAQVPAELHSYPSSTDTRVVMSTSTLRLERAFSLGRAAAAWAVLTLAYAAGRITEEQFHSLLPGLSAESGITPPPVPPSPEPKRPPPPPPPTPPPPRPISHPPTQPQWPPQPSPPPPSWPASQPVSPPQPTTVYGAPPILNVPVYPQSPPVYPQSPGFPPLMPAARPRSGVGRGVAIGIGVGVLLVGGILYALAHHSDSQSSSDGQSSQSQPGQSQPGGSSGPSTPPSNPSSDPSTPAAYVAYADSSSLFQLEVPGGWLFKRADNDTTLENVQTHLVQAALFPKDAQHAELDGWLSAGIRVLIYLPPSGQVWQNDWSADWQKRTFASRLQGYTKYQNTNIESVTLGNLSAETTAVEGEGATLSEPEVARLYIATSPKYLLVIDVQMPASQRQIFDAIDHRLRQSFVLKVQ